jgi:AbrB family looped-hinge helix DNA binding protein
MVSVVLGALRCAVPRHIYLGIGYLNPSPGCTGIELTSNWQEGIVTCMKTTLSTRGRILIPAELRRQDGIEPGQQFSVERIAEGKYLLKRTTREPNEGLLELLLACPVKDWLAPLDRSEMTTDLAEKMVRELT